MGLDTTHNCWHGSYGGFTHFRMMLAEAAGYHVIRGSTKDNQFDNRIYYPHIQLDWGHVTPQHNFGEWDETPSDPLIVLLVHSDCDGVIHPEQSGPLADRMEELLPNLRNKPGFGYENYYYDKAKQFIKGLRDAHEHREMVEFH